MSNRTNEIQFFRRLARLLSKATTTRGLLEDLAPLLKSWHVDGYWLGHAEADGRVLVDYASSQEMMEFLAQLQVHWDQGPWAQGPTGQALRSGKPCHIPDWREADKSSPFQPAIEHHQWRSTVALPMQAGDRRLVLSLYSRTSGTFGKHHTQTQIEELGHFLEATLARDAALDEERRKLARLAFHDPLTDLPNRAALDTRVEEALARADRQERLLAVALLDLDDFKLINDLHGHAAGDALLIEFAHRLQAELRKNDFACRLGGDEFVLLLEELDNLDDLETLLARLHATLTAPIQVSDTVEVAISLSLGLVIYPLCFDCGKDAAGILLRAADQALYQAKAQKNARERWWTLFDATRSFAGLAATSNESMADIDVPAYGTAATQAFKRIEPVLALALPAVVEAVYAKLSVDPESGVLIQTFSSEEKRQHRAEMENHLGQLLASELDENAHRDASRQLGRIHAMVGIRPEWVVGAYGLLLERLHISLPSSAVLFSLLSRRLAIDLQAQLTGHADITAEYDAALQRITSLAMRAQRFTELGEGMVEALAALSGVVSVTLGRPDAAGHYVFEFIAGDAFRQYLQALAEGRARPIDVNPSEKGQGPTGRAWRSGAIERCLNYATDPRLRPWREHGLALGVRSSVAIPLVPPNGPPQAVLTLYLKHVGGFSGQDQERMLQQLRHLIGQALQRVAHTEQDILAQPLRDRWRKLLKKDALELHYQPILDLRSCQVVGAEALARLREPSGTLIMPGQFLPSFGEHELRRLFEFGLHHALETAIDWETQGHTLNISLNLPPQGLSDSRYLGLIERALTHHSISPQRLKLELLETAESTDASARDRALDTLKGLGVRLLEDDLGSGYSSLLRLDRLPFDGVKIDQTLVRHYRQNPLRTLNFIRHLTRLAQDMGKWVTVEGLETPALVEASAYLGAEYGQGYAIARPMPATDLPTWIDNMPACLAPDMPSTALGALAVYLDNGGCAPCLADKASFTDEAQVVQRFCQGNNPVQTYIAGLGEQAATLGQACDRLAEASTRGLIDKEFERARLKLMECLLEQARNEYRE
ncbi:EAL domain-containing protein [Acidihalobacter ferrooxydans]|uniref:Diguanylate cyclase DosC n=1 Tax=Acidihalobacter ferrooxydans TaxID=1765967 RepID=A0A1P8UDN0_9GAMM|nr:EAL domain-containing protein [Acidihalobacter ferrooxydans]APZ41962.1 hypothetical protein BW247_01650 [Acidihalobacter ferrooxydans]